MARDGSGRYDVDPDGGGPAAAFQVWQQRRIDSATGHGDGGTNDWVGTFDLSRDAGDMLHVARDDILMIKVDYWWNP